MTHAFRPAVRRAATGLAAVGLVALAGPAEAETVADFYKNKPLTILVPSGSGGLNALYARTVGDRLGANIPGNPKVIYQYMPGGGGLKGTNYCYNVAPKDGSVICEPLNAFVLVQLLRPKGVKYDAGKFHYLGNASNMNGSFAVLGGLPVKTLLDARKHEVIFAATGKGSDSYYDPTVVNALLGTKFKLVMGYKGGGALDLSLERGESQGRAGPLLSWIVRKPQWLEDGTIRILAQVGLKKMKGFDKVPLITSFAKDDEQRKILEFISSRAAIGRPFVAPPGVPAERIEALKIAFDATMVDPAFLADAKKRRLTTEWSTGGEVDAVVQRMLATSKALVDKTRAVLGYPK